MASDDSIVAGHLVRYLLEEGRIAEGLAIAQALRGAVGDSFRAQMLLGLALHARSEHLAAENVFRKALDRLEQPDRRRFEDLRPLLDPIEKRTYRDMEPEERATYEVAVWRLANPLYLVPGNERWTEHMARHVSAALLAEIPVTHGMVSWGSDLEELTLRYGVPTSRARIAGEASGELRLIEYYDPDQLALFPVRLATEGFDPVPVPGTPWPLFERRTRSRYRPNGLREMVEFAHQVTRFPAAADSVLVRWDGGFRLDSVASSAFGDRRATEIQTGLFVLGPAHEPVRDMFRSLLPEKDSIRVAFEAPFRAGRYVFSLEALEPSTRLAARARFSLQLPAYSADSLALSDLLVCSPFGDLPMPAHRLDHTLRPRSSLIFESGDTVGIFAELHRLADGGEGTSHYRVEIGLRRARDEPALTRVFRRVGEFFRLGFHSEKPIIAWDVTTAAAGVETIAFDILLPGLPAGLYALDMTVLDQVAGTRRVASREIRLRGPS